MKQYQIVGIYLMLNSLELKDIETGDIYYYNLPANLIARNYKYGETLSL